MNKKAAVTTQAPFGSIFASSKKAISPVVATALLLVVAVTAVVGFQTWFNQYSSSLFTDVESQDSINSVNIDSVVNNKLYVKVSENTTISQIKLGNKSCDLGNKSLSKGMNSIDLGTCPIGANKYEDVVVFTDKGILQENHQLKNTDTIIDCSSLNGGEWVRVPGNSNLGTDSFCVMKYEAKDVSGIPTSQPSQTPWVNINQTDARSSCNSLGSGYHLITDKQWVTMARNIENTASNWNSSEVGVGYMMTGHNDDYPGRLSVSNTSDPYDQTGDSGTGSCDGYSRFWPSENPWGCKGQKRTFRLSTDNIVWDIGGNVWEWMNDTTDNADLGIESTGWRDWIDISGYNYLKPFDSSLNYTNGVGRGVYTSTNTNRAFRRGGNWYNGRYAGVFSLSLRNSASNTHPSIGFRCSYTT